MTRFTTRPVIRGTHGVVTAGHYLASAIGLQILTRGGNAIDAGVAMGFALNVLEPQSNGIAGEAPILIYAADQRRVFAVNGQGTAPQAATIPWFKTHGIDVIPGDGLLPTTVPAAFDAWVTALARFGTLSLAEVLAPAIELAEKGFPVYERMRSVLLRIAPRFREEWPTSEAIYLPKGEVPAIGDILVLRDWADTFRKVVDAERRALRQGRVAALEAARDHFYKGEIADTIDRFVRETQVLDASGQPHSGLLRKADLAGYHARVEAPVKTSYRGYDVYKCGPWCQGPVFLQQLNLLEGFDLAAMGHNTAEYIHTVIEASKLAFADREQYYGDPEFVAVPLEKLLSKEYAAERRTLIDPDRASIELRPGGAEPIALREGTPGSELHVGDTTHLDVIDRYGNMMSATPSGGWIRSSPVVTGLGFPLGTRGQMFHLDPSHAEALMPGRRPSTTLTPSLVLKNDRPCMVFGTPGGDRQDQWTLQFFLNVVDFEMDLQEAIDAPTVHTLHFPGSFYPHDAHPGLIAIEGRVPEAVRRRLEAKGHRIQLDGDWSHGRVLAVRLDQERGVICGAASPRAKMAYAVGW